MFDEAKLKLKLLKHLKDKNTIRYLVQKLVGDFCKPCKLKAVKNPAGAFTGYCKDCQIKASKAWEEYVQELRINMRK